MVYFITDYNDEELKDAIKELEGKYNRIYEVPYGRINGRAYDNRSENTCCLKKRYIDETKVDYRDYLKLVNNNWDNLRNMLDIDKQKLQNCSFIRIKNLCAVIHNLLATISLDNLTNNGNYILCKMDEPIQREYIVRGDVYETDSIGKDYIIVVLTDDLIDLDDDTVKLGVDKIKIYIPINTIVPNEKINDKYTYLLGKRLKITGSLYVHEAQLLLKANECVITNEDTFYKRKINKWKQEIESDNIPKCKEKLNKYFEGISQWKKVGLISNNQNSKGYKDFKNIFIPKPKYKNSNFVPEYKIISACTNSNLSVENIIKEIDYLNDTDCDCICIVRGGGNKYDLINFNSYELIKAIVKSKKPIALGIGHSDDTFTFNEYAKLSGFTPSELAIKLKSIIKDARGIEKSSPKSNVNILQEKIPVQQNEVYILKRDKQKLARQLDAQYAENKELSDKIILLKRNQEIFESIKTDLNTKVQDLEEKIKDNESKYREQYEKQDGRLKDLEAELKKEHAKSIFAVLFDKLFGK